jgi:hypothetical protein
MKSVEKRPNHLNPSYHRALITCAVLNLAMLFIEGGAGFVDRFSRPLG